MPRRPRPVDDTDLPTTDEVQETSAKVEPAEKVETIVEPKPRSRKVDTPDTGIVETKEAPQPAPAARYDHREGTPNGLIIGQHDPLMLEGDDDGVAITVTRDVYRKVYPYGSRRPSYILLYPRGAKVAKSLLQRQAKG